MFKRIFPVLLTFAVGGALMLPGCKSNTAIKSKRAGINEVVVHFGADPQKLNPVTSSDAYASEIQNQLFQNLVDIDANTYEIVPILATKRAEIVPINDGPYKGGMSITYELRPEAKWDNGTPVTVKDVEFSLKCIKNPMVDCEAQRGYMQFMDDIKVDAENPRKFTFLCTGHYLQSEIASGTFTIIPEYAYDPDTIMRAYTVKQLNDPKNTEKLKRDANIIKFATQFDSEKHQREAGGIVGSGPYEFVSWTTTQRVILKKKANWWGDALAKAGNKYFNASPDKLTYEIINDPTTSYTALKDEKLDVDNSIKSKDFKSLQGDEQMKGLYNLYLPDQMAFTYLGLNMKKPGLDDLSVRQALSHALDKQYIIHTYLYDFASQTIGPFHPTKSYYDKDLKPYAFDLEAAKKLLDDAGWKDSDGDGIRDKQINGQKVDLKFAYKYPSGGSGSAAENIGLMLKDNCSKLGIGISLEAKEWTVFLDELKAHNFDVYIGSWVADPVPDDPYQIWHSKSYATGSNYVGYGSAESDALIDSLRNELDEAKRKEMYIKLQEDIYKQCPYVFLFTPKNKIVIHKRFDNAPAVVKRPGYEVNQFKLNPSFGVKAAPAN
jgi:peptide/nickel transport system substrate-binding protein